MYKAPPPLQNKQIRKPVQQASETEGLAEFYLDAARVIGREKERERTSGGGSVWRSRWSDITWREYTVAAAAAAAGLHNGAAALGRTPITRGKKRYLRRVSSSLFALQRTRCCYCVRMYLEVL